MVSLESMKETDLTNLHKRITKARENEKLFKYVVAEYVGVSRQTLTAWENNESRPTIEQLDKISKVTGYPIEYFLYEDMDIKEHTIINDLKPKIRQLATLAIDMNKLINR